MNMFKRGDAFLTRKMKNHGSETVEYITGNVRRTVKAQFAVTFYEMADNDGMLIKMEVRDFIIETAVLLAVPKRGDTIIYNNEKYIVMPLNGTDVFKYADAFKKKFRIHTKKQ